MEDFSGKVIVITGGLSGIGAALSKLLFERGATIAVCGRSDGGFAAFSQELETLRQSPSQRLMLSMVDVKDSTQVNSWIASVVERFGALDHAANIAGSGKEERLCHITEKTDDEFTSMVDINFRSFFNCMRSQLPHMSKGSSVVNCGSGGGTRPIPNMSLYSAAKAGMENLTRSAAREVGPRGIRVNTFIPGYTLSPPVAALGPGFLHPHINDIPLMHAAEPEEVAKTVLYLFSSYSSYQTGTTLVVDGGHTC